VRRLSDPSVAAVKPSSASAAQLRPVVAGIRPLSGSAVPAVEKIQKFDIFVDTDAPMKPAHSNSQNFAKPEISLRPLNRAPASALAPAPQSATAVAAIANDFDDDFNDQDDDLDGLNNHLGGLDLGPKAPIEAWGAGNPTAKHVGLTTPADIIRVPKDLGTLETMHEILSQSFAHGNHSGIESVKPRTLSAKRDSLTANVWVVKYVDYTAKYGLGFLLNTGSAGVYFNDSTKIVLSPDGNVFLYVERRRKIVQGSSEHVSQSYTINSYPPELQKKVTLLKHFRSYLLDQSRESGASAPETVNSKEFPITVPTYDGTKRAMEGNDINEQNMVFLKKWVRTRHAILFRLSNRTVQVVFFDKSEVLLSSEAKIVTYVNKVGERTEHTLGEVLSTGRADIAKRLKYTKDILYRLINLQTPK